MIVQIFITQTEPIDSLSQQTQLAVLDVTGGSRVGDDRVNRLELTQPPVDLAQQQRVPI
ncbi:MAG: hypothetical protein AB2809_23805 [Candidatus Thiodiazotropha sp.]